MKIKKYLCCIFLCGSLPTYGQDCSTIKELYARDACYMKQAAASQDSTLCQKVESPPFKSSCAQLTQGAVDTTLVATGNTASCAAMQGYQRRNCITMISVKNKDYKSCKQLTDSKDLDSCLLAVAEELLSVEPCEHCLEKSSLFSCLIEVVEKTKDPQKCKDALPIVKSAEHLRDDATSDIVKDLFTSRCKKFGGESN